MKRKNKFAVALGRMAKGKEKTMTDEAIEARRANLEIARKLRWQQKKVCAKS